MFSIPSKFTRCTFFFLSFLNHSDKRWMHKGWLKRHVYMIVMHCQNESLICACSPPAYCMTLSHKIHLHYQYLFLLTVLYTYITLQYKIKTWYVAIGSPTHMEGVLVFILVLPCLLQSVLSECRDLGYIHTCYSSGFNTGPLTTSEAKLRWTTWRPQRLSCW